MEFSTQNPADGSQLTPVTATPTSDVERVVSKARRAQRDWMKRSLDERADLLRALARHVLEDRKAIVEILSAETGRGETECLMSEIVGVADFVKQVLRAGKKALAPEKIKLSALDYPGKKIIVEMVPRGVVGIIAPWNYPLGNFFKSIFPALLAGNAIVLKPSEHTPRSGAWLADAAAAVLPEGLVGLVQGGGEVGEALLEAPIDAIVFTGSVRTGKRVASRAGEKLIPCSIELGGKDAAIVLSDCDLERTVAGVAQWGIHNAGQNCAAIERVYVEQAIADEFVKRLAGFVGSLRVAPQDGPSDLGPLQNEAQLAIVEQHVDDAKAKGAKVVCGGKRTGKGLGYAPTVLDQCTREMEVVKKETFGPVIAVTRVKDAEEAVRAANDCVYGLNGSVWTTDIERGMALARRLEVGVSLVNNHAITGILPETPWTGVKDTGPGIASSRHAYHVFTRPRTLFVDRARAPDPWWMPANADLTALGEALVARGLGGGLGVLFKLAGLVGKRARTIRELASKAPPALPSKK